MNSRHSIRVGNSMPDVAAALHEAAGWIAPLGVSDHARHFLCLAIEELATNWIKHGGGGTKTGLMTFELGLGNGRLSIKATDDAPPFDPTKVPLPRTDQPPEGRAPGGLGILLLRKMADAVSYERLGSWNILRLEIATH